MTTPTRQKVTKASVAYRQSNNPGRSCGTCIMYHRGGTCDLVAGPIAAGAVCSKWEERLPLAVAAAEAYLSGWALTDAPYTGRIAVGLVAAVAAAGEQTGHPGVLEATLQLGQLDGIWAVVYQRRERLTARHLKTVTAAWRACTSGLDAGDVVRRFRADAYLTGEATKDPTKKWWQELAVAAALGWLRQVYYSDGYDALVAALADAIRSGMAEGEAGALALAAARQGTTGFRIGQAFTAAYDRLATDHTITQRAADAATRLIDAAAGDVGRRLASLAGDGATAQDMTAGVEDVMAGGQAGEQSADWTVWAAILAGAKALWSRVSSAAGLGGSRGDQGGEPRDQPEPGDEEPADGELPPSGPDTPPGGPDSGQILLDWITAGDDRVCVVCDGYQSNGPYAPEAVPDYPHPRCVIGSTRVEAPALEPLPVSVQEHARIAGMIAPPGLAAGNDGRPLAAAAVTETGRDFGRAHIRAATDREYVGDVVTIRTALGHELTATPNHPVATRRGWVPIAKLQVGDHVLSSTRPEWVIANADPDVNHVPPRIEQVAESFSVELGPVPTAAEDFHGDGAGSDVHVVRAGRLLMDHGQPGIAQPACQHQLSRRHATAAGSLSFDAERSLDQEIAGLRLAADSIMSRASELGALLRGRAGHTGVHALAAVPGLDASAQKRPADSSAADAEDFCERLLALASGIAADEIISVRRHPFSGHVYNLETVEGWYISNAIVTHNCRCSVDLAYSYGSSSFLLALLDSFAN